MVLLIDVPTGKPGHPLDGDVVWIGHASIAEKICTGIRRDPRLTTALREGMTIECRDGDGLGSTDPASLRKYMKKIRDRLDASAPDPSKLDYGDRLIYFASATAERVEVLDRQTAENQSAIETSKQIQEPPDARHSPDFRSVNWFGNVFNFTPTQAACIKILWEAWENKTPAVGEATLLESAGVGARSRLVDIFRNHAAWNTIVVSGGTKGAYRLQPPTS